MKQTNYSWYLKGIRDGIPIALGYLAVSVSYTHLTLPTTP